MSRVGDGAFRPVVVLPTYNNCLTLESVLTGVHGLGLPMIIVNDGSTDGTQEVLERWRGRAIVQLHERNRGKAAALRTGFACAHENGFTHAATLDTDGQLDAADLPGMIERAKSNPRALVLGSRAWKIENYPSKNALGRRLANAAIRLQCGAKVEDSQCGLRVYPVGLMRHVTVRSSRFSFEAEAITRAVWAGCSIEQMPVRCVYMPSGERVTHYVPGRDTPLAVLTHLLVLIRSLLPWPHRKWLG